MTPNAIALVTRPLAANASAHPYDVLKMKSILAALGHYEAPEWGLSQFPDPALFDALRAFQEKRGLQVDGVMKPGGETEETLLSTLNVGQAGTAIRAAAAALQEMGQGGDEILAHITPEEAQLLDAITDGASVNPHTGLLEFYFDASADHKGNQAATSSGSSSRTGGGGYGGFDASSDHKTNQGGGNRTGGNRTGGDRTGGDRKHGNQMGGNQLGTFDPSADQKARQNEIDAVMRANDEENQAQTRRDTVLAPDNDPSFTSGFFSQKNDEVDAGLLNPSTKPKSPGTWPGTWQVAQAAPPTSPTPPRSPTSPGQPKWTGETNKKGWDEQVDENGHYPITPGGSQGPTQRSEDMTDEEYQEQNRKKALREYRIRMLKRALGY